MESRRIVIAKDLNKLIFSFKNSWKLDNSKYKEIFRDIRKKKHVPSIIR